MTMKQVNLLEIGQQSDKNKIKIPIRCRSSDSTEKMTENEVKTTKKTDLPTGPNQGIY